MCLTLFIFSEGSCYKNNLPGNLISEGEKEPFVPKEVALTAALCLPQPHHPGGAAKVRRGQGPRRGRAHRGLGASQDWRPFTGQLGLEVLKEA